MRSFEQPIPKPCVAGSNPAEGTAQIEHLLTAPRSPTTTGKIERFHRSMRTEFDTTQVFTSLRIAQAALDEWVDYYNQARPHQSLGNATPDSRFHPTETTALSPVGRVPAPRAAQRDGDAWVSRKVAANGIVCVGYQQVSVGKNYSGSPCDVLVTGDLLQFWVGSQLVKTVARTSNRPIRKKHAAGSGPRP